VAVSPLKNHRFREEIFAPSAPSEARFACQPSLDFPAGHVVRPRCGPWSCRSRGVHRPGRRRSPSSTSLGCTSGDRCGKHPSILFLRFEETFAGCGPVPLPPGAASRPAWPCSGAAAPAGRVAPWTVPSRNVLLSGGHGLPNPVGPRARRLRGMATALSSAANHRERTRKGSRGPNWKSEIYTQDPGYGWKGCVRTRGPGKDSGMAIAKGGVRSCDEREANRGYFVCPAPPPRVPGANA